MLVTTGIGAAARLNIGIGDYESQAQGRDDVDLGKVRNPDVAQRNPGS
jgi:hypothetical protein